VTPEPQRLEARRKWEGGGKKTRSEIEYKMGRGSWHRRETKIYKIWGCEIKKVTESKKKSNTSDGEKEISPLKKGIETIRRP